ncbi:hypothetical protein Y886_43940 [Xanthomonas hyacinthi DSM 19077]|nr:hypothetical protein Y886_43940 [Xanthomonas hyacinthi DSM 19077]
MADNYKIREFHGDISRWIDSVSRGVVDCVEMFATNVHEDLVNRSPVDTGRYKANWQITANKPPLYALNQYDRDGSKTIAEGKRAIYAIMRGGGAVRSIYFSNMLIYANALEYGHSKQAPSGVLGIVAVKLRSYMAKAIKDSRAKNAL